MYIVTMYLHAELFNFETVLSNCKCKLHVLTSVPSIELSEFRTIITVLASSIIHSINILYRPQLYRAVTLLVICVF